MSGKTLGKGGKPKVTHNKHASVIDKNTEVVEALKARQMESGKAIDPWRITAIDGMDKDGQFYVTASISITGAGGGASAPITRRMVVPPPFLKNPGEKKAKINCPDLIKVGAVIFYHHRAGDLIACRKEIQVGRWHGEEVHHHIYNEIAAVLSEEQEKEWAIRGLINF
jgi:hypothetical protein